MNATSSLRDVVTLYYDLTRTDVVQFEAQSSAPQKNTAVSATVLDEREPLFKLLWQSYFDHVNMPERNATIEWTGAVQGNRRSRYFYASHKKAGEGSDNFR